MKNRKGVKVLVVLILLVFVVAIYFTFFFYHKSTDLADYYSKQEICAKTKYVNDAEETTWKYIIRGESDGMCEIEVTALQVKKGFADRAILEGQSMTCFIPLNLDNPPEKDLTKCHGELKEGLQNLIIQELHKYILENVGEIGEELEKTI